MLNTSIDILGVPVRTMTGAELLRAAGEAVERNEKKIFAYVNIHTVQTALKHPLLKTFLASDDVITYPDGEGVRLGARMLGEELPAGTALTRWIWELAGYCESHNLRLYLLGGKGDACRRAVANLQKRFPRLLLSGHHGYFHKSGSESASVLRQMDAFAPDILIVGFGTPAQEEWIYENAGLMSARAVFTGGSCIDFVAGEKSPAPAWLGRMGIEWMYRLLQEPRRLGPRYVTELPAFFYRILIQRITQFRTPPGLDRDHADIKQTS